MNPNYENWFLPERRFLEPFSQSAKFDIAVEDNDRGSPNTRLLSTKMRKFFVLRARFSTKKDPQTGLSEWDRYLTFMQQKALGGALPFNIPDPLNYHPDDTSTWLCVRLCVEEQDNCLWTEDSHHIGYWLVTMKMEIL